MFCSELGWSYDHAHLESSRDRRALGELVAEPDIGEASGTGGDADAVFVEFLLSASLIGPGLRIPCASALAAISTCRRERRARQQPGWPRRFLLIGDASAALPQ
jgi:hypothetical protein